MIRTVIVEDSRLMREMLQGALEEEGTIQVVGMAAGAGAARALIRRTDPDVVALGLEASRLDELDALGVQMQRRPVPVVMLVGSPASEAEAAALRALAPTAVALIAKPIGRSGWNRFAAAVRHKLREAAALRPGGGLVHWRGGLPEQQPPRPPMTLLSGAGEGAGTKAVAAGRRQQAAPSDSGRTR